MWCALGYSSIFEKPAKTLGHTLKVWSMQFISNDRSIFSLNTSDLTNLKCSIDAYTLQKFIEQNKQETSIEWLRSYLGICVTDEIFNEIDKVYHKNKKNLWNLVKSQFLNQECDPLKFQESYKIIKDILAKNNLELDEINTRHIARCLAADIPYFVTQKSDLLNLSSYLYMNTGVQIISLEEAIDLREINPDVVEFQPSRLENKTVQLESLNTFNLEEIGTAIHQFYPNSNKETLFKSLQKYNNDSANFGNFMLVYEGEPHILAAEVLNVEKSPRKSSIIDSIKS
jgi:hypothetical protein